MHRAHPRRRARGVTLIELLTAVAIVAIVASIAYPSYMDQIRSSKRATAQSALLDLANKQQSYLLDRRRYATTTQDLSFTPPAEIAADYDFAIVADNAASPPQFTLSATPASAAQSAKGEPTLTIDSLGTKAPLAAWKR